MPEKRKSAFLRATQEAQTAAEIQQENIPVVQLDSSTVAPLQGSKVIQGHGETAKKEEKITFYLTAEQANKLDELAYEHKRRRGKRINRNDIVRFLIDQCSIESLDEM